MRITKKDRCIVTYNQKLLLEIMREWYLTKEDVADILKVSVCTVEKWLTPKGALTHKNPSEIYLRKLKRKFDGNVNKFWDI